MGLAPSEVLDMTLPDYEAAVLHYAKSQGSDDDEDGLSGDEFDEMLVGIAGATAH